jgi:hypothetical protein
MPKTPQRSLRDRLAAKKHPSVTYPVLLADPAEPAAAAAQARSELRQALAAGDETATAAAQQAADDATAALDACWQPIVLRSIPAEQLTALIAEHPPAKEQKAQGDQWNPETFQPALIAACAHDAGMTAEQWAQELASDRWSTAERNELFGKCLEVNLTTPAQRLASQLESATRGR